MLKYEGELIKDEHTGERYGVYEIIGATGTRASCGHKLYVGQCTECKHYFIRRLVSFNRKHCYTEVCNHLTKGGRLKRRAGNQYTFKSVKFSRKYLQMIDSCYDKTSKDYNDYGRKGVTVCEEWLSNPEAFEEWCNKTYDTTLAKQIGDANVCLILNYLGDGVKEKVFSPETCSWTSKSEAARWKSGTTDIHIDNKVLTGKQTAKELGVGQNAINKALRKGRIDIDEQSIKEYADSIQGDGERRIRALQRAAEKREEIKASINKYIDSLNITNLTLTDVHKIHTFTHNNYSGVKRWFIDNIIQEKFPTYNPNSYYHNKILPSPYNSHPKLRNVYSQMISRCQDPNNRDYKWYGAKGVKVCEEWRYDYRKFYDWAMASGYVEEERPTGAHWNVLTIDRIDPYGNYEPSNCRWATNKEQMQNRRCNKK